MITRHLVNLAVNQCLARTFLTSLTVFIVVFVLYVFGGESLHGFAYALFMRNDHRRLQHGLHCQPGRPVDCRPASGAHHQGTCDGAGRRDPLTRA